MKPYLLLSIIFLLCACQSRDRQQLAQMEAELNKRKVSLDSFATVLSLKEQELNVRQQRLDSLMNPDSSAVVDLGIVGTWDVKMVCSETTCPGSAVGDTKTETWDITVRGNEFVAHAKTAGQLSRIYSGIHTGNTLELVAQSEGEGSDPGAKIVVRLHKMDSGRMSGEREIVRATGCKIIYTLEMSKKTS